MRMAEPRPFGLTFFVAITRAMVSASLVYKSSGGKVETVETLELHRRSLPLRWDLLCLDDFDRDRFVLATAGFLVSGFGQQIFAHRPLRQESFASAVPPLPIID